MFEFIKDLCHWKNTLSSTDCITIFIAVVTLIVAIRIPHRIKWEQFYQQLLSDYRSHDFGVAIMEIGMFFNKQCSNDISKIPEEYAARFHHDFGSGKEKTLKEHNLHYQRRLLTQFYYQLDLCANSSYIGKKRIQRDFTSKESDLLKILFYMNKASQQPGVFIDITTSDRVGPCKKGMNSYIKDMYSILKESPNYVR